MERFGWGGKKMDDDWGRVCFAVKAILASWAFGLCPGQLHIHPTPVETHTGQCIVALCYTLCYMLLNAQCVLNKRQLFKDIDTQWRGIRVSTTVTQFAVLTGLLPAVKSPTWLDARVKRGCWLVEEDICNASSATLQWLVNCTRLAQTWMYVCHMNVVCRTCDRWTYVQHSTVAAPDWQRRERM